MALRHVLAQNQRIPTTHRCVTGTSCLRIVDRKDRDEASQPLSAVYSGSPPRPLQESTTAPKNMIMAARTSANAHKASH